jgi:hypothetical protein
MSQDKRVRVTNNWHPEWTPEIERWVKARIRENMWRFDKIDTPDDVMQEARMLYHVLEQKYPIVNDPRHFFTLFKTSLLRFFIDKSRAKQRTPLYDHVEEVDLPIQAEANYGYIQLLLEEMPEELKIVLTYLTSRRFRRKLDRPTQALRQRETLNMIIKRRFSLTSDDPVGDLKRYLLNS